MNSTFNIKTGIRIPALDGLRGLAILMVLFQHYVFFTVRPEKTWLGAFIHAVFPLTWSGVDLFFVLSGFLIGGILLDQRNTDNYFKVFYVRRICRIFPFYFFWLALFYLLPLLISPHSRLMSFLFDSEGIPKWCYLLFLQNFYIAHTSHLFGPQWLAPTWSLAVEEQFYLLAPLMIWLVPRRKFPYVLLSLILCIPLFRLYLYLYHFEIFEFVLLPCRADTLLIGILCAYWVRTEMILCWIKKNQRHLYPTLVILLAGAGYLTAVANGRNTFNGEISFQMVFLGYSWLALLYGCLLLIAVTAEKGAIAAILRFKLLRYLGIISYSVYLMHMAIIYLVFDLISGRAPTLNNFSGCMATLTAFFLTVLLATLSWHLFEKPIIRWGHSFSYTRITDLTRKGRIGV